MLSCVECKREFLTESGFKKHITVIHDPVTRQKGRNGYSDIDWSLMPWDQLGSGKRRERLLIEADYSCTECGYNKRRMDGGVILEIDHIDGNHTNNAKENLRVLCPNCHALTPNFRNWGGDRKSTRTNRSSAGKQKAAASAQALKDQRQAYEEHVRAVVTVAHETGSIDFSCYGWQVELAKLLNEPNSQVLRKRLQRIMPEFYATKCYCRGGAKRLITV